MITKIRNNFSLELKKYWKKKKKKNSSLIPKKTLSNATYSLKYILQLLVVVHQMIISMD